MGCHTWFYRVATEDECKIIKSNIISELESTIKQLKDALINREEYFEELYFDQIKHFNNTINKSKSWDESIKEYYLPSIQDMGFNSVGDYIKDLKRKSKISFEEWLNEWIDEDEKKLKKYDKSINTFTPQELDNIDYSMYIDGGLIRKIDGKIYVESGYRFRDGEYRLELHDVFRYHNYDDESKLRSYDETIKFCEDKNINLNFEQMKELKIWFDNYIDSFIEFG